MSKTYINGITIKEIDGQYGKFMNISVNIHKIKEFANDKGYVNMTVSPRREVGQYGETHTAVLNEYQPKGQTQQSSTISVEDIPF